MSFSSKEVLTATRRKALMSQNLCSPEWSASAAQHLNNYRSVLREQNYGVFCGVFRDVLNDEDKVRLQ
jgi:hypothetical protein